MTEADWSWSTLFAKTGHILDQQDQGEFLKHQANFVAADILNFFFFHFSYKISCDISYDLSALNLFIYCCFEKCEDLKKKNYNVVCYSHEWCFKG